MLLFTYTLLLFSLLLMHGSAYSADENILTKPGQWLENLSQEDTQYLRAGMMVETEALRK